MEWLWWRLAFDVIMVGGASVFEVLKGDEEEKDMMVIYLSFLRRCNNKLREFEQNLPFQVLKERLFFVEMIVQLLPDNSSHKHFVVVLFLSDFKRSFHFGTLLSWQTVTFDRGGRFVGFNRFWLVFEGFFFDFDFYLRKN